jgi:hypothetical protein
MLDIFNFQQEQWYFLNQFWQAVSVDYSIYASNPQSLSTIVLFLDGSVSRFGYNLDRSAKLSVITLPMKQQFVITHRHTTLKERKKTRQILNRTTCKHVMFLQKYKKKQFCGHNILTEGVFLIQLSSNVGISFWGIVWVIKNCCFMSTMRDHPPLLYYYLTFKCSQ